MKRISQLTFRYMKKNFGRTVTTIIGVMAAALLMFCIFTVFSTAEEYTYSDFYNMEMCTDVYMKLNGNEAKRILSDAANGKYGMEDAWLFDISNSEGIAALSSFENNPFSIPLKSGRFPKNNTEILVTDSYEERVGQTVEQEIEIVDSVTGEKKKETRTYRICGVMRSDFYIFASTANLQWNLVTEENRYFGEYTLMTEADLQDEGVCVCISLKNKKNILLQAEELGRIYGTETVAGEASLAIHGQDPNSNLDRLTFLAVQLLLAYVFMLAMIIIVRNAFNISVNERLRDYSLLRCIGITRRQVIRMVLNEAGIVAIAGSILGMALGYGFLRISFFFIVDNAKSGLTDYLSKVQIGLYPRAILLTFGSVLIITFVAIVASIEKIYKLNLVEAISQSDEFYSAMASEPAVKGWLRHKLFDKKKTVKKKEKKEKIKKGDRIGSLLTRLFGIEVGYAYRNSRRRKGKFWITVVTFLFSTLSLISLFSLLKSTGFMFMAQLESSENKMYCGAFAVETSGEKDRLVSDLSRLSDVKSSMVKVEEVFISKENGYVYFVGVEDFIYSRLKSYTESYSYRADADVNVLQYVCGKGTFTEQDYELSVYGLTDPKMIHVSARLLSPEVGEYIQKMSGGAEAVAVDFSGSNAKIVYNIYPISSGFQGFTGDAIKLSEENIESMRENKQYYFPRTYMIFVESKNMTDHPELDKYVERSSFVYVSLDELLKEMEDSVGIIRWIVISILVISILLFYINSINIQKAMLLHRKSEFQTLAVLGMTRKQMNRALDLEAFLANTTGLLLGILLSVGLIRWLCYMVQVNLELDNLKIVVDWSGVVISVILAVVTALGTCVLNRREIRKYITLLDN